MSHRVSSLKLTISPMHTILLANERPDPIRLFAKTFQFVNFRFDTFLCDFIVKDRDIPGFYWSELDGRHYISKQCMEKPAGKKAGGKL